MNLRRIKYALLRLSVEEKTIAIGGIVILANTFMPWYSISFLNEKTLTLSGFSGDMGVVGVVTFLFTVLALGFVMAEHMKIKLPSFGYKKGQISLFFFGESTFLLLLTIGIYARRSFEYSNAEIRFGLFAALAGASLGTFAAFAQIQKTQKKEVESFFNHEEQNIEEEIVQKVQNIQLEEEHEPIASSQPLKKEVVKEEVKSEVPLQEKFFYEEPEVVKEPEVTEESEIAEEEIIEDEMVEGVAEEVEVKEDQKSFFAREAGIKVDMNSVKPVENKAEVTEEKNKQTASEQSDFYDDM